MKPAIIADDEETVRNFIKRIIGIASPGREIHEVANGRDLVEKVREGNYAFVITDNAMPRMNGLEAVVEIRKFSGIPVCLTSGTLGEEEAIKAGANHFLKKPYPLNELIKIVQEYCSRNGEQRKQ